MADLPENAVHPRSRDAWRTWLAAHHMRDEGVWLAAEDRRANQWPR